MLETAVLYEWLTFGVRWLHVITAIAWIGSSFYFIALDLGLRRQGPLPEGVSGEEWQVHGGGFYHIQKYNVAPPNLPEHLTWFKWEAYSTWLSGFVLLVLIYYVSADLYLIDPGVLDLATPLAIALSVASLAFGWLVYDALCKSRVADSDTGLMLALFALIVVMAFAYSMVFSGRAAFLHLGAFTATIMSANVFLCIIPNQKIVVADLKAGRSPDPRLGKTAKQRSTHNNYLTLPVLFLMLSMHNPLAFQAEYAWVIAALVFLTGVSIRHFFNTMHAGKGHPWWTWGVTAALFAAIIWLSVQGRPDGEAQALPLSPQQARLAAAPEFEAVHDLVQQHCAMCHATRPFWPNMASAPKGVVLETAAQTAAHARQIYLHAGRTDAMPPARFALMEPAERALIVRWYHGAWARQGD
ncbi:MAG: cysteine desulfurase [Geminicoccaceae bacterium]|nr:MAG: cysteine desulfurase [Geminicoccaceae bacterium]